MVYSNEQQVLDKEYRKALASNRRIVIHGQEYNMPNNRIARRTNAQELEALIVEYLSTIPTEKRTFTGLCSFLGLYTREFENNIKSNKECAPLLEWARGLISSSYENVLKEKGHAGSIFAMKNLAGWRDRQEIDANVSVNAHIVALPSAHGASFAPEQVIDAQEEIRASLPVDYYNTSATPGDTRASGTSSSPGDASAL